MGVEYLIERAVVNDVCSVCMVRENDLVNCDLSVRVRGYVENAS